MPRPDSTRRSGTPWRVWLAVLCVLLAVFAGTVQVVHVHADRTNTHADCSLCAAAHVGVQVVQQPVAPVSIAVTVRAERHYQLRPATPLSSFALFNRPPPAV